MYNHGEIYTSHWITLDISREGVEKHHIKKEIENQKSREVEGKMWSTSGLSSPLPLAMFIKYTVDQEVEREKKKKRKEHKDFGIRLGYETFFQGFG